MKRLLQLIKKYLGEILIVVGSFMAVYNLFSFDCFTGGLLTIGKIEPYYYYSGDARLQIAIGVALVILGILIIRAKKNK